MNWKQLLSSKRLGKSDADPVTARRSPFQIDYDRIVFSSAFRRLQDKTQVFPLAESDYVRTRLTHSIEVACIARSIGTEVGEYICRKHGLTDIFPSDCGAIAAAAALAHDLGNPPFGHSGEQAIRHWFASSEIAKEIAENLSPVERKDIEMYEGNAQGFRILTRLQMPSRRGGMQLTNATLAAFSKYPIESPLVKSTKETRTKKFGFFQSEKELFKEIAEETGLPSCGGGYSWSRHPFAYLVEAADDITYRIIDLEDGHRLGLVTYQEVENLITAIAPDLGKRSELNAIPDDKNKVEYLRAHVFGKLIGEIVDVFIENEEAILNGQFAEDVVAAMPSGPTLKAIKKLELEKVYSQLRVLEIEAAGFEVAQGLLDIFVGSVEDKALRGAKASPRSEKMLQLIPKQFIANDATPYIRLMNILDFFAGMTDTYAVTLFKKVKGISLPG